MVGPWQAIWRLGDGGAIPTGRLTDIDTVSMLLPNHPWTAEREMSREEREDGREKRRESSPLVLLEGDEDKQTKEEKDQRGPSPFIYGSEDSNP